jgi:hypothetical protein
LCQFAALFINEFAVSCKRSEARFGQAERSIWAFLRRIGGFYKRMIGKWSGMESISRIVEAANDQSWQMVRFVKLRSPGPSGPAQNCSIHRYSTINA